MGLPATFGPTPRRGRAQCGDFGPEWNPTNRLSRWHDVRGRGNEFKKHVINLDGAEVREPIENATEEYIGSGRYKVRCHGSIKNYTRPLILG